MADFVNLPGVDGVIHRVNPDRVADVFPVPEAPATQSLLVMEWPPGVQSPPYLRINLSAATVASLLASPSGGGLVGEYLPAMVDLAGTYTPAPVGNWKWLRILNRVMVWGEATLDPPNIPPFGQIAFINFDLPFDSGVALGPADVPGTVSPDSTTPAPAWALNIGAGPTFGIGVTTQAAFRYVCDGNVGGLSVGLSFAYDIL